MTSVAVRRLQAQHLIGESFASAGDAVRWMGAVQSQDYAAAKWGLGLRVRDATDASIDMAFDRGEILRTHVLRPTWHFVHPQDVRWMLALTGPRVMRGIAGRHRQLGIDTATLHKSYDVFAASLTGGKTLTRTQLGDALDVAGVAPDGQRLPHLLMAAEFQGLITSGPRRGKQFTYALLDERASAAPMLEARDAVTELARRYFTSHGPAQLQDLAWWSGLSLADARAAVAAAGSALACTSVDGRDYWSSPDAEPPGRANNIAHLLPSFDEYTVAYRDRSAALHPDHPVDVSRLSFGSILANVVTLGGFIAGAWRRVAAGTSVRIDVSPFGAVSPRDRVAVARAAGNLQRFLDREVELAWR